MSKKALEGTILVAVGAAGVLVALWLTWWSAVVHISLPSAAAQQAGYPVPTSTYPFGDVPGHTVWIGWLAAALGIAALAAALAVSRGVAAERGGLVARAAMILGLAILLVGVAAMLGGKVFVVSGFQHFLVDSTHGAMTTVAEFQQRVGRGAQLSFSASPAAGILVVMLGGIAITVGAGLLATSGLEN